MAYWKVSLKEISERAAHHGMRLVRTPAVDFSPHSLRDTLPTGEAPAQSPDASIALAQPRRAAPAAPACALPALAWCGGPPAARAHPPPPLPFPCPAPAAVSALERSRAAGDKVYVHCTAGLGRSPAVAIAALYWFTDMQLDEAYAYLTGIRPCGPSKDAIRGATYDLLSGRPHEHFQHEPPHAFATLSSWDRDAIRAKLLHG